MAHWRARLSEYPAAAVPWCSRWWRQRTIRLRSVIVASIVPHHQWWAKRRTHTLAHRRTLVRRPARRSLSTLQSAFDGDRVWLLFRVVRSRGKWNFRRAHYNIRPSGTVQRFESNFSKWMVSIYTDCYSPRVA